MQFNFVDNVNGFMALADEWENMESRSSCHIFQTHRFLASWLETAACFEGTRPALVVYHEAGILRGILPACSFKRVMVPFLGWMGGHEIVDYGDIIYDKSARLSVHEFLERAFSTLRKRLGVHFYLLHNVRNDAAVFEYLARHFTPYKMDVAPYINLSSDPQTHLDSQQNFKKMKSDTLRQIKRMRNAGTLEFVVVDSASAFAREVLTALIHLKKCRYVQTDGLGVLLKRGYEDFYFTEAALNRNSHISALLLDGKIVAAHFGYVYKKRFYYLVPAFDLRWAAFSPGRILHYFLLKECFDQGLEVFDLCIGAESYKNKWTCDEVGLTTFVSGNCSGKAYTALIPWLKSGIRLFSR